MPLKVALSLKLALILIVPVYTSRGFLHHVLGTRIFDLGLNRYLTILLTGLMTAALLCRTGSALEATAFGVIWHVAAGAETGKAFPGRGNLAGDIVNAIPLVMKNLMEKRGRKGGAR